MESLRRETVLTALRRRRYAVLLAIALVLACAGASGSPRAARAGPSGLVVRGTIVTMDDSLGVIERGRVVVRDGRILAVLRPGERLPRAAAGLPTIAVSGFVFPGLVNAHNHLAFNVLPPWEVPLLLRQPLRSVHDWRDGPLRQEYVAAVREPQGELLRLGLGEEIGVWAELRELAGGTTTTQGSFGLGTEGGKEDNPLGGLLARNVDLDGSATRQSSVGIHEEGQLDVGLLADVLEDVRRRTARAFLVHLSEGINAADVGELYELNDFGRRHGERCGPLMKATAVIHGTGYGRRELSLMAECGTDLVASVLGNLLFYGRGPDLAAARDAGVNIVLSSDWAPVGSRNVLEELKVVDFVDRALYGDVFSDRELVEMVTRNAARAIGWEGRVGRLAPGTYADLLVVRTAERDPYRALIEATEREVALVVVGGEPLWGEAALVRRLRPAAYELVPSGCGFSKAAVGPQAVSEIGAALARGFQTVSALRGREPAPLFGCADRAHFGALKRSPALAAHETALAELPTHLARIYRAGRR